MPCMAFFALWGFFFLWACVIVCGFRFRAFCGVFGGSLSVFSVRCCVLSVGFDFVMIHNRQKSLSVAFCSLFDISYRLNFFVACRLFLGHCGRW